MSDSEGKYIDFIYQRTLAEKMRIQRWWRLTESDTRIFVPVPVLSELPPLGESVKIYTYFSVREDGMSLFGFLSRQDLAMFKQLIGVNGHRPQKRPWDPVRLKARCAADGGGVRQMQRPYPGLPVWAQNRAQRIILDLKDKIRPEDVLAGGLEESLAVPEEISGVGQAGKEAVEALTALGYSAAEAAGAVKKVKITEEMTAEDVLKGALRHLAFL